MKDNPSVSIIIVNYNTRPILEKCLDNLLILNCEYEIIVVDNASADGSAEMVKNRFPNVHLVRLEENLGLAHGYNIGLSQSQKDFILFLGSDAFPKKDVIEGLADYLKGHPETGITTGKLLLRNGEPDRDAHRGFPTPWTALTHFVGLDKIFKGSRVFDRYFLGFKNLNEPHEIDLCISHFMMVRRTVFDSLGKFDENFFVFGEDVDFCYRAKKNGWKIMYLPQWIVLHYKGLSIGIRKETRDISTATAETKTKMSQQSIEAMKIFYRKHYQNKYPRIITLLVHFAIWLEEKSREQKLRRLVTSLNF